MGNNSDEVLSKDPYFLDAGYIYMTKNNGAIQAVLGSNVAVCIWDKVLKCGSMNHFSFPKIEQSANATPKYGDISTIALIKMMHEEGCRKEDMVAHVFGGAFPDGGYGYDIGKDNVNIALQILNRKGIKIASQDVGGSIGRKIIFDINSGHIAVLKVHKVRQKDWHDCCFEFTN